MNRKLLLSAAFSCILTAAGLTLVPAAAAEGGIVYTEDGRAQYVSNDDIYTGRITITPTVLVGDTDQSGDLDTLDASILLKTAAEAAAQGAALSEEFLLYGDCDRNGTGDANDAALLLLHVAETGAGFAPAPLGYVLYFADADGYLQTGWQTDGEALLYAGDDYRLLTGWQTIDGSRYWFDESGEAYREGFCSIRGENYYFREDGTAICSEWIETAEGRYYFNEKGEAVTGLQRIDGVLYYFDQYHLMQTGWQTVNGRTYYFDEDGSAHTGWLSYDELTYYFGEDCTAQYGLLEIDGKLYFLYESGVMASGWLTSDGTTYYFDEDGAAHAGWLTLPDGSQYYFNASYKMLTGMKNLDDNRYFFDETGLMQRSAFITYKDNLYYFGEDGAAVTGWQTLGGNTYYFRGSNYTAVKGIGTIGGVKYYFHPETCVLYKNGTHNGITTDANGAVVKVLLGTEYISQIGYPTGCESASAVMLLRDAGYSTSIDTFIDEALDIGWLSYENGRLYGPHPAEAFIGDPRSTSGYGCYAPVIVEALSDLLTGGDTAEDLTGTDLDTLCARYIDRGQPVAVWATINMVESTPGTQWTIRSTGESFTWKRSEHCLVLVGYDENYYYLNDPYKGNGLKAYSRSVFEDRFEYLGSQSVVIHEAE